MGVAKFPLLIAVDFDGTVVEHDFPRIGLGNPGAIEWLRRFQEKGAKIILWTCRSNRPEGDYLNQAVNYMKDLGIQLHGINANREQDEWSSSPKVHANIYIDDAAFGCPLLPGIRGGRSRVDWTIVGPAIWKSYYGG